MDLSLFLTTKGSWMHLGGGSPSLLVSPLTSVSPKAPQKAAATAAAASINQYINQNFYNGNRHYKDH